MKNRLFCLAGALLLAASLSTLPNTALASNSTHATRSYVNNQISAAVKGIKNSISGLQANVNNLRASMEGFGNKINELSTNLESAISKLTSLEGKQNLNETRFATLENRVLTLESSSATNYEFLLAQIESIRSGGSSSQSIPFDLIYGNNNQFSVNNYGSPDYNATLINDVSSTFGPSGDGKGGLGGSGLGLYTFSLDGTEYKLYGNEANAGLYPLLAAAAPCPGEIINYKLTSFWGGKLYEKNLTAIAQYPASYPGGPITPIPSHCSVN